MPMSTGLVLVASRAFVLSAEAAWLQDPEFYVLDVLGKVRWRARRVYKARGRSLASSIEKSYTAPYNPPMESKYLDSVS